MRWCLATLVFVAGAMPAAAQWLDRPWPAVPRTSDGTPNLAAPAPRGPDGTPDFTGLWNGSVPRPVLDAANAQPWDNDLVQQHYRNYFRERPSFLCRPSGPEADRSAGWKRFLQTPTALAILRDDLTYRVIHLDGRTLEADPAPSWMGYSVGRWDGDTLVVESNGYNDKTWLSADGRAHTEALRVTERYRRTDFGHLQIDVTYTDPAAYVKPWGFTANMTLAADTEMLEAVCERSSEHWPGSVSDATASAVTVGPDVLQRYVGVYRGMWLQTPRTVDISLSGGQLVARVLAGGTIAGDESRPLVPQSQTLFDGLGLGYRFIVDDKGVVTHVEEIHISGAWPLSRQR